MNGGLPPPSHTLFREEACVLSPSLIHEVYGIVRMTGPRKRGDRINNPPKFGLLKGIHQISSRLPLAAHIDNLPIF
jgi:hypothetical protein